jgi:L-ribulose-5-phosphate 3-epimerase
MARPLKWDIGVCSWSLGNELELLTQLRCETGISTLHLHIRPEFGQQNMDFIDQGLNKGWHISSGMVSFEQEDYFSLETIKATGGIVPNQCWSENKSKVCKAIDILSDFDVSYLSFHFGFLDANSRVLVDRVKALADYAASKDVMLLMETGQETAQELVDFIQKVNHPAVGINYDPANMILYGKGEPVKSLRLLISWVKHIHIKDAITSKKSGCWGQEVPWGKGEVDNDVFLEELANMGYRGALCVERERGQSRLKDIYSAISMVRQFWGN